MLKNSLLFTKYTTGKKLKNSCNKKCRLVRRYVYMNLNIQRKIFKSVFEINTYSSENECFHVFLLAIYDKDLRRGLTFKK